MPVIAIAQALVSLLHASVGPNGFVVWVQPQHLALGLGFVGGHPVSWLQVQ